MHSRVHAPDLADLDSPWLVGILAKKLDTLDAKVERAAYDAETAKIAVEVLPKLLGGDGDRRYFVAFQTPAELRGDGGLIGNFAEIAYQNGDISLTRNARDSDWNTGNPGVPRTLTAPEDYKRRYGKAHPENTIQNITLSPDFPSVAQVIEGVYPQTGGQPVDGVISFDPIALAQFLRLTGNVRVPGYNVELTPDNTADILLQQQYTMFPDSEIRRRVPQGRRARRLRPARVDGAPRAEGDRQHPRPDGAGGADPAPQLEAR